MMIMPEFNDTPIFLGLMKRYETFFRHMYFHMNKSHKINGTISVLQTADFYFRRGVRLNFFLKVFGILLFIGAWHSGQSFADDHHPKKEIRKQMIDPGTRRLLLAGGSNFRDLGSLKTKDGRVVKRNRIFRGDELNQLTDGDLEALSAIPITTIVDLRGKKERAESPDRFPSSVKNRISCAIEPGNLANLSIDPQTLSPSEIVEAMKQINEALVSNPECVERFREFFRVVQGEENTPILFHCTAGKDRTGMAAALFLSALGVDEDTIMQDYLLSNRYLEKKYADKLADRPGAKNLYIVKAEYLRAGLDRIKKDHGSVNRFLSDVLSVDFEKMKNLYLSEVGANEQSD